MKNLLLVFVVGIALAGCSKDLSDYKNMTLGEIRDLTIPTRHDVIEEFVDEENLGDSTVSTMYACISEKLFTKSLNLKLEEVLGWCKSDVTSDRNEAFVNFDEFESSFSPWDGSYSPLEKMIKNSMHDEDSYEHVETRYSLQLSETPTATVSTTFRGNNAYGGKVRQQVKAKVLIETGDVIEILQ